MGDNGKAYSTVTPALIDRMRGLCRRADLILPNATEAALLLERQPQTDTFDDASAQALADDLLTLAPSCLLYTSCPQCHPDLIAIRFSGKAAFYEVYYAI